MKSSPIDIELARELFEYRDGDLIRRVSRRRDKVGDVAGTINSLGYVVIWFDGRLYKAHRLIYALVNGIDPSDKFIDHIDGNKVNNRIENLRLATNAENMRHRVGQQAKNTSGYRGVSWHTQAGKWQARAQVNGRMILGGLFTDIEDANAKAVLLRAEHFGEFQGKL